MVRAQRRKRRRATATQSELLTVKPRGTRRQRLRKPKEDDAFFAANPERVYVAVWLEWNRRKAYGAIGRRRNVAFLEELLLRRVTQAEADLVLDVIQWLGTNVGQGFLFDAERRIELAQNKAQAFREKRWRQLIDEDKKRAAAERVAKRPKIQNHRTYDLED